MIMDKRVSLRGSVKRNMIFYSYEPLWCTYPILKSCFLLLTPLDLYFLLLCKITVVVLNDCKIMNTIRSVEIQQPSFNYWEGLLPLCSDSRDETNHSTSNESLVLGL